MALTDVTPPLSVTLPVLTFGVSLKDANGGDVNTDIIGNPNPIFTFTIGSIFDLIGPWSSSDTLGSDFLSALKTFFTNFDWDTYGASIWSGNSVPRPVTFSAMTVTQWDASTTDVSP